MSVLSVNVPGPLGPVFSRVALWTAPQTSSGCFCPRLDPMFANSAPLCSLEWRPHHAPPVLSACSRSPRSNDHVVSEASVCSFSLELSFPLPSYKNKTEQSKTYLPIWCTFVTQFTAYCLHSFLNYSDSYLRSLTLWFSFLRVSSDWQPVIIYVTFIARISIKRLIYPWYFTVHLLCKSK